MQRLRVSRDVDFHGWSFASGTVGLCRAAIPSVLLDCQGIVILHRTSGTSNDRPGRLVRTLTVYIA